MAHRPRQSLFQSATPLPTSTYPYAPFPLAIITGDCVYVLYIQGLCREYPAMPYETQRHLLKKIQETLYIGQWCFSTLQSKHLETSHNSPNHRQLPCHIFLNLIDSQISSLSKVILILGKARSCRAPSLSYREAESPG